MSRWWESERSLLAARVRSTRRRLRASFRGAFAAAMARAENAASDRLKAKERELALATERAVEVAGECQRTVLVRERYQMTTKLVATVELAEEVFVRAKSIRQLNEQVAEMIADAVRRKIVERMNDPAPKESVR